MSITRLSNIDELQLSRRSKLRRVVSRYSLPSFWEVSSL